MPSIGLAGAGTSGPGDAVSLATLPVMVQVIDAQGCIVDVNELWLRRTGYARAEVLGRPASTLLIPAEGPTDLAPTQPFAPADAPIENHPRILVCRDGSHRNILLSASRQAPNRDGPAWTTCVLVDVTHQRRSERALAESERRYRTLVEEQTELVSLATPDGRLCFVNRAYASHFGTVPEAMLGTQLLDYVPAPERSAVAEHLARLCRQGGSATAENRMLAVDGSGPRWVAWTNHALTDASGRVTTIHSVGRDVTEAYTLRSQLEAKSREIEDLYEHAPCGYHSVGVDGRYLKINATELAWIGCRREEVVGRLSPRDFFAASDQDRVCEALTAAKRTGAAQALQARLIGRHGIARDVSVGMSVVLDEDGSFLMTRTVIFDISAQKAAERAVERLSAKQKTVLESELFGIARLCEHRIVWANRGLARMLGYDAAALEGSWIGQHYADAIDLETWVAVVAHRLTAGVPFRDEVRLRHRSGRTLWVELSASLLEGQGGESLWLFADVTARKQAELALQSSRALLQRTGEAAGVGGWEYDLVTGTLSWTEQTCRLHGVPLDFRPDLASAIAFYAEEDRPIIEAAVAEALATQSGYDLELKIVRRDGAPRWIRTVGAVECVDGKPVRLVGAIQDITVKVEQMGRMEQLYTLAEAQRGELAAYRAHAESEAEIARFLLSRLSRVEQLDAAGIQYYWEPAESFSGDIIAVATASTGDTYGLLADATGHGLAAAINLIPLTKAFYTMAAKGFGLLSICEELNRVVKEYSLADRFVAATLVRVRHRDRLLEVVNAGNPPALLLDADRRPQQRFGSGSIPLGILTRPAFRPVLETAALSGNEAVLIYSDGLVEALDLAGQPFGQSGLEQALDAATGSDGIADAIRIQVRRHSSGRVFADDISVLVLGSRMAGPAPAPPAPAAPEADGPPVTPAVPAGPDADGGWSCDLRFTPAQIRSLELVPVVVNFAAEFGMPQSNRPRLFTVLSELIQNAVDHGLLGLDSALKAGTDGFERYHQMRSERLAALVKGEIRVSLRQSGEPSNAGRLRIVVTDSGPGFDPAAPQRNHGASDLPHGRGLALLRSLSRSLVFNAAGNQATVDLDLLH